MLALGLGFVGWLTMDPRASQPDTEGAAEPEALSEPTKDTVKGDDVGELHAPQLEAKGTIVGKHGLGSIDGTTGDWQQLVEKLSANLDAQTRAWPGFLTADPATVRLVRAHAAGWRRHVHPVIARLFDYRSFLRERHILVSVLEAMEPLDENVLRTLTAARVQSRWARALGNPWGRRLSALVVRSMGREAFIAWVLNPPNRSHPIGPIRWPLDEAALEAMGGTSLDGTLRAQLRERILDMAAGGHIHAPASLVRAIDPEDLLASLAPFPRAPVRPNGLAAERDDFIAALQDEHPFVRIHAIAALHQDGVTPNTQLRDPLLSAFLGHYAVRRKAIELAPFILPSLDVFIPTLNQMLATDDEHMADDAAKALVRLAPLRGETDMARLVGRILGRTSTGTRRQLVQNLSLFKLKPRDEVDLLGQMIGDEDEHVRYAVIDSLGQVASHHAVIPEAIRLLEGAQRDRVARVAQMAAAWLEELRLANRDAEDDNRKLTRRRDE